MSEVAIHMNWNQKDQLNKIILAFASFFVIKKFIHLVLLLVKKRKWNVREIMFLFFTKQDLFLRCFWCSLSLERYMEADWTVIDAVIQMEVIADRGYCWWRREKSAFFRTLEYFCELDKLNDTNPRFYYLTSTSLSAQHGHIPHFISRNKYK